MADQEKTHFLDSSEESLPRPTRRLLAQLRTGKSPMLYSYLHKIDPTTNSSPLCPLCKTTEHTTNLFICQHISTKLTPDDPVATAALLAKCEGRFGSLP